MKPCGNHAGRVYLTVLLGINLFGLICYFCNLREKSAFAATHEKVTSRTLQWTQEASRRLFPNLVSLQVHPLEDSGDWQARCVDATGNDLLWFLWDKERGDLLKLNCFASASPLSKPLSSESEAQKMAEHWMRRLGLKDIPRKRRRMELSHYGVHWIGNWQEGARILHLSLERRTGMLRYLERR